MAIADRPLAKVIAATQITDAILAHLAENNMRPARGKEPAARQAMAEIIVRHLDAYDQRS